MTSTINAHRTVREFTVALSLIAPRSDRWIAERSTTLVSRSVLRAVLGLFLLLFFTLANRVGAQTDNYDAFEDFSFASNPTPGGVWRYGFTPPGAAGPLTLYTHRDSPFGLSAWRDATDPNVIKNETGHDLLVFGAIYFPASDYLHVHPGPNGERSVVRGRVAGSGTKRIPPAKWGRAR